MRKFFGIMLVLLVIFTGFISNSEDKLNCMSTDSLLRSALDPAFVQDFLDVDFIQDTLKDSPMVAEKIESITGIDLKGEVENLIEDSYYEITSILRDLWR